MRALIVGFGGIARGAHYPVLRQLCKHIDVVDVTEPPAQYDVNYIGAEMPTQGEYDLALVASPPVFHCEHVVKAAQVARRILCEKPPAMNATEVLQMQNEVKKRGASLLFGFHLIREDSWRKYKEIVTPVLRELGFNTPLLFDFIWVRLNGIPAARWFREKKKGGGATLDLCSHGLSLFYDLVDNLTTLPPYNRAWIAYLSGDEGDADVAVNAQFGGYYADGREVPLVANFYINWRADAGNFIVIDSRQTPPVTLGLGDARFTYNTNEVRYLDVRYVEHFPHAYGYVHLGGGEYAISGAFMEETDTKSVRVGRYIMERCYAGNPYEREWQELLALPEGYVDALGLRVQEALDAILERAVVLPAP